MIQASLPIPDSFLVICPGCFDIWARLEGQDTSHWWHRYVPCVLHPQACHPYGCQVAGCLLELSELSITDLSEELIFREFSLLINEKEVPLCA